MKLITILSSYYFIALSFASISGCIYAAVSYPLLLWLAPSQSQELAHTAIETSMSLVELVLLLPEIIVTGLGELLHFHLGYFSMLHLAVDLSDGANFLTCELLLLAIGVVSFYLFESSRGHRRTSDKAPNRTKNIYR